MKCLKCVPGSGKFQGHMGTHKTAAQSNRGKLFVADAATPYKTSSKDRKDRSDKIQKTKETRNVIICDTCENEYLLEDIGLTLQEATVLKEWKCGVCLGTHSQVKKAVVLKYNGVDVDPEVLLEVVNKYGGIDLVRKNKKWQLISGGLNISSGSNVSRLNKIYAKYFEDLEIED